MSREHKNIILKTLDNSTRILFWSLDEFLLMAVPVFVGIGTGSIVIMGLGFVLKFFYKKFKKRFSHQSFMHSLYWFLPTHSLKKRKVIKNLPSSHKRELLL